MSIVSINKASGVPKYKQIVVSIEDAIRSGVLKKGDKLPSINRIKNTNNLSRDTVLMAFNTLKARGIVQAVVGKGYYVASENILVTQKVFLLFDELNAFKEDLYNSLLEYLGNQIQIDIFFHHFNGAVFKKLIQDNAGNYSFYVIMPANLKGIEHAVSQLPKDKVYVLDQYSNALNRYPAVYQNFEKDIYNGLLKALKHIKKYNELCLVFSEEKQPEGLLIGFQNFCFDYDVAHEIQNDISAVYPKKNKVYIVLTDRDLIRIIKKIKETNLVLAKDVGVICYNETLLKEIVMGGITTISTDFHLMGKQIAKMLLTNTASQIENPSELILRASL